MQAIQSLSKLGRTQTGVNKLILSDLVNVLKDVLTVSDVIRYRVYEVQYLQKKTI